MSENISFKIRPIGVIHTPHTKSDRTPIQPVFSKGIQGTVEIYPEFREGIKDLEGFSYIYLLYFFHLSKVMQLQVVPYLDKVKRGIFATRAPHRPNRIGMSLVRLLDIENCVLTIEDVDILDKTPLLDIKPYIQRYDTRADARSGWQDDISNDIAGSLGKRDYPSR